MVPGCEDASRTNRRNFAEMADESGGRPSTLNRSRMRFIAGAASASRVALLPKFRAGLVFLMNVSSTAVKVVSVGAPLAPSVAAHSPMSTAHTSAAGTAQTAAQKRPRPLPDLISDSCMPIESQAPLYPPHP